MEIIGKEQFNLDEEITKLNEPIRYSSTRLKYFYTEQDIRMLFDKREAIYLKQIEEKDKEVIESAQNTLNIVKIYNEQLSEAKELLNKAIKAMGSVSRKQEQFDLSLKIQTFLNKQN